MNRPNYIIAIPCFARAGKQPFIPNRQKRERESRVEGATMCHNKLQHSKVTKEWRNIPDQSGGGGSRWDAELLRTPYCDQAKHFGGKHI